MSISSGPIRFSEVAGYLGISNPVSATKIIAEIPGATVPFAVSFIYGKTLGGAVATGVSPVYGFTNGGSILNILGSGFTGSETVTVGGVSATSITLISSTQLQCTVPANTTGTKNVVVDSTTLSGVYTYYTPASTKSKYRSFTSTTVPAGSATYFHDVTWSSGLGLYAAVAQFSSSTDGIITSSDGSTWTRRTSPFNEQNNTYLRVITNDTNRFMTSGYNTNETAFSSNGTTWTQSTGTTGRHSSAYSPTLDMWVIPGPDIIYYSSNNGSSWSSTSVTVNPLGCIWAGAPFNKFFVFPRANGNILYSSNGSSWTTVTPGTIDSGNYYYAAAYSSDLQLVMTIANNGGYVYTSSNGTTWTGIGSCDMIGQVRSLLWNSDMYAWYASGKTGVAVSSDGINWTKITNITTDLDGYADYSSKGIAYSSSLDKFVTAHATMYVSDVATKGSILLGTNKYVTFPNSADFQMGTGDFTFEWFQYQTSITNTQYILQYGTSFRCQITSAKNLEVVLANSTVYSQTLPNYYESSWVHIAVSRSGTNLRVFVNGTQLGTTVTNSSNITDASTVLTIGGSSTNSFIGKLTGIHIMKGTAKYTANFSRIAHEIVGKDINTKLLLPVNSTNFLLDFSSAGRTATNNGSCTFDSGNPFR